MLRGQFTMDDLLTQLRTIQRLGPLREVFAKLPMFGAFADQVDGRELGRVEAMIQSMTRAERREPRPADARARPQRRAWRAAAAARRRRSRTS